MEDYATIANTVGAFPNVVSQNVTAPSATDGTPYIKNFIDDLWGFSQALMDAANLTPDASPEAAGASQRLTAIQRIAGHPGEIIAWPGRIGIAPATLGLRLLELTGQTITIATYQDLVDATYVGDPANPASPAFWKAQDTPGTIPNVAGPYFVLPDLRGLALRGLDLAGTIDPGGPGRLIGDFQNFLMESHTHVITHSGGAQRAEVVNLFGAGATQSYQGNPFPTNPELQANTINPPALDGAETRMVNSAIRWCIRY